MPEALRRSGNLQPAMREVNYQGLTDLAAGRDGDLRLHHWLLNTAPPPFSTWLESSFAFERKTA